jgi:hypothetical protein
MSQGTFNQAFPQVFVSGVPTPLSTGKMKDLAPEQIGLFTHDSETGSITLASGSENELLQFAQGIHDFKAKGKEFGGGVSNAPKKSPKFKASDIVSWKGIKANRKHQGQIVALGYDGVDANKTLTAMLDTKDLIVNIRLWGNQIEKVMGNRNSMPIAINVNKGCLPISCDVNSIVAADTIADSIIAQVQKSLLTTGFKFTDLIQVSKIKKYAVNPTALTGLLQFHKFTASLTDDGSNAALGLIQSQYNSLAVKRTKRLGTTSIYEVSTQDGGVMGAYTTTTPATFSLSARTVAECEVCPAGSTKVDSAKAYELKGLANATAPVIAGSLSVTLVGSTITEKTYLVVTADTAVDATVIASGVLQGYTTRLVSTTRDICNFAASTYSWVVGTASTKAPHSWKITLADTQCGTDRLAELQANYPGYVISIDATGTCVHTYKITNYSDAIEPGCYPEDYRYTEPSAFEGIRWVDFVTTKITPDCIETTSTSPCVAVGVIFESMVEDYEPLTLENQFYNSYDRLRVDPTHFQISVQSLDPNSNVCEEPKYPVTKLQSIVYPRGEGAWIIEEKEKPQLNRDGYRSSINPMVNKAFGYVWNAKDGKFYDEYQLEYKTSYLSKGFSKKEDDVYISSFYFEEGQGKQFETLVNGLIAKQGLKLKPVYL